MMIKQVPIGGLTFLPYYTTFNHQQRSMTMDARPVATVGGFPIMEEFETGTSDHFKMIFEAAIRLRNGGMSDHQAIKTAINIHDSLLDVLNGEDSNG